QVLADPKVPVDIVKDYAIGPRWVLSCAALAALAKREDRDEVLSDVLDYFDNITPWAIYFALAYFVHCNPRPAVGAPPRSAKEWWRDNIFLAPFFRDHFIERESLGDTPAFDWGVTSATAAQ